MNEAEAVPGRGLPAAFTHLLEDGHGLLAAGYPLLVVAQLGLAEADVVEGHRLPDPVPDCDVVLQGTLGVSQSVSGPLVPLGQAPWLSSTAMTARGKPC